MKIRKRFVVEVEFSDTDGCCDKQTVTEGDVRRAINGGLDVENLKVEVKEGI